MFRPVGNTILTELVAKPLEETRGNIIVFNMPEVPKYKVLAKGTTFKNPEVNIGDIVIINTKDSRLNCTTILLDQKKYFIWEDNLIEGKIV